MLELLYTALLYLIQPLIWIRLWVRGRKAPAYRKRWGERYGFYRHPLKPGGIMLHSVSVGETLAAIPLVRALRHRYPDLPITVTTMTPTGSERVQSAFGKDVQHVYLPYDHNNVVFSRVTLHPRFSNEILLVAGQARKPVQHRQFFIRGFWWEIDADIHFTFQ